MSLLDLTQLSHGSLPHPYEHMRIMRRIGKGGQGAVYEISDSQSPTRFRRVFKIFLREHAPEQEDLRNRLDFGLRVPDHLFSRIYDLINLQAAQGWESLGFTMDYLEASLEGLLGLAKKNEWKFPGERVTKWIRQLASAVDYLGEKGYVHRDLKPSNLGFRLPRAEGGALGLVGANAVGEFQEDYEDADLITSDLDFVAKVGSHAPAIVPDDKYKHPELYKQNEITRSMDLYAFAQLIDDFREFTDDKLEWLNEAQRRCLDVQNPPPVGVLSQLVSPIWETQTKMYEDAGFSQHGLEKGIEREWVYKEFEAFRTIPDRKSGGLFLIDGPAGSGKSFLLRMWSHKLAQHQGFYFRVGVRTTAREMVKAVSDQLKKYLEELIRGRKEALPPKDGPAERAGKDENLWRVPELHEGDERNWIHLLLDKIAAIRLEPKQLLIFLDALDEIKDAKDETKDAKEAEEVVQCLPKRLDVHHFIIASTRPPLVGWNYVNILRKSFDDQPNGFQILRLDLDRQESRQDVVKYVAQELKLPEDNSEVRQLAEQAGHLFLLTDILTTSIREGYTSLAQALAESFDWLTIKDPKERLDAFYKDSWNRINHRRDSSATDPLSGIHRQQILSYTAAMLCVLGDFGIDEMNVTEWLKRVPNQAWDTNMVRTLARFLHWFVEPVGRENQTNPVYRVRHKSIRDYLTKAAEGIPDAEIKEWHFRVSEFYIRDPRQANYPDKPNWENVYLYGKKHMISHLLATLAPHPGDPSKLNHPERWRDAVNILMNWDYLGVSLSDPNLRV